MYIGQHHLATKAQARQSICSSNRSSMDAGEREDHFLGHFIFISLAGYTGIGVNYSHLRILFWYLKLHKQLLCLI